MSSDFNRRRSRSGRGNSGVASLELALVLVVFMVLLVGTFDLARYFYTVEAMTTLLADAGRYSMIRGSTAITKGGPIPIDSWISDPLVTVGIPPLLDPAQGTICIAYTESGTLAVGVNTLQVTVIYPFTAMTPGLSALSETMQTTRSGQGRCRAAPPANMLVERATYSY
jgi:Flp pilus assembly protein TadG